jgi:hypothetical protein
VQFTSRPLRPHTIRSSHQCKPDSLLEFNRLPAKGLRSYGLLVWGLPSLALIWERSLWADFYPDSCGNLQASNKEPVAADAQTPADLFLLNGYGTPSILDIQWRGRGSHDT